MKTVCKAGIAVWVVLCLASIMHAADPSILLITIDTLRADRLGGYGDPMARTPFLDRMAAAGRQYSDAGTDIPLTLPSHSSILSGLPVSRHGVTGNGRPVGSDIPLLPELLKNRGYTTAAVISGYPLVRKFGLNRGFDRYADALDTTTGTEVADRRGDHTTDIARDIIRSSPSPLFLWVHLYDPHKPYAPPPTYDAVTPDPYRGEIAFTDACVARVLTAWTDRFGVDTWRIIVADHGEALGDHGELTHGVFLYQETVRVPMIAIPPANRVKQPELIRETTPVQAIFRWIVPGNRQPDNKPSRPTFTILYTRYPYDRYHWSPLTAVRRGSWKLIDGSPPELYDLSSDPGEMTNVQARYPETVGSLRRDIHATVIPGSITGTAVDADTRRKLETLGYTVPSESRIAAGLPDPRDRVTVLAPLESGLQAVNRGQWKAAARNFKTVLRIDPDNPVANNNMGLALIRTDHAEQAIPFLRHALEITPDDIQVMNNLGVAYRRAGRTEEAVTVLRSVLGKSPDFTAGRINLCLALAIAGKREEALRILREGTRFDPDIMNHPAVRFLTRK